MRLALRLASGASACPRQELASALCDRRQIELSAAYAAVARLTRLGLLTPGRLVRLTPAGRRHLARRLTWWGGPLPLP